MLHKKQEKELGTNFFLFPRPKNMTGQFMKSNLHRPVKILQFLISGRIQKYLT